MKVQSFLAVLLFLLFLLAACSSRGDNALRGSVLVWHSWEEEQAAVLDTVLENFVELNPDVNINTIYIPADRLLERYEVAAEAALGPDLVLAPSSFIRPLAEAGLIQPIGDLVGEAERDRYLPVALETVRYDDALYGLPESLRLMGLFYNKRLVTTPATTLDELEQQANQGRRPGLSTNFVDAFWGVQAFGGQLFDENGAAVLDRGGFANWLDWLKTAQENPNFVLSRNPASLTTLFAEEEIAYLVNEPDVLADLQERMGESVVGVAPLPSGPIGSAGPFVESNAFLFNIASSARQRELAVDLALFITNAEQETLLMRRAGRIPANRRVRVNPRVDTVAYSFFSQARSAVPLTNSARIQPVLERGEITYNQVLQGVIEPLEAAQQLTQAVNEDNDVSVNQPVASTCTEVGTVELWHELSAPRDEAVAAFLADAAARFRQQCPNIVIDLRAFEPDDLRSRLAQRSGSPTAALISNAWLAELVAAERLQPLDEVPVDRLGALTGDGDGSLQSLLQRYNPIAVETMNVGERLYGLPFTLEPVAFYYNRALVAEPVRTLNDLSLQTGDEAAAAIDVRFNQAFWGVSAFGGQLFAEQGLDQGQLVLGRGGGFVDWLAWLVNAQRGSNIVASTNASALRQQFVNGSVGYLTGGPSLLAELEARDGLGGQLGVTTLPAGPAGDAQPFLMTKSFVLDAAASGDDASLALHFLEFVTNLENQTALMETARRVPAHIGVDTSDDPHVAAFVEQARNAAPYPNRVLMSALQTQGTALYAEVLAAARDATPEAESPIPLVDMVRTLVEGLNEGP